MAPGRDNGAQPDGDEKPVAALGAAPQVAGKARIKAGVRAALFGDLETDLGDDTKEESADLPERLGRFRLLSELGRGGMGEVYGAYDPELDRKVAIKLLRRDVTGSVSDGAGHGRLQREAQAMARVNHPNVASVHEVGTFEGRLYVAMEYVEGGTLRQWIERGDRSVVDILDVFVQAGRGLAAAHEAGLVHRDFKPDNVLIGRDGRVRVVDFGLARSAVAPVEGATPDRSETSDSDPMVTPLTRTGAVMGTPAYMSAEQHAGKPADARSDQFSFCVALWEALFGERPFAGKTYAEVMANVVGGHRREPPSGHRVPARVVSALQRGLSADPLARFSTIGDLLAELRPASKRGRWVAGGLAVGAAAVVATWAAARGTATTDDPCAAVQGELDGIWDDERREAARQVVLGTGHPYAPEAWPSIARRLDDYAAAWVQAASEACVARRLAHADPEIAERRQRCLQGRRDELDELVGVLEEGDPAGVLAAVQAVMSLSEIRGCSDERRLHAWTAPRRPEAAHELAEIRARLGLAKIRGVMGRYPEAVSIAAEAADRGRHLDDPATEAAALLIEGQYLERAGDFAKAESVLAKAVERAEVSDAHETRAKALNVLVYVVGQDPKRWSEVQALASEARTVLRVMGSDPMLEAGLDLNLGNAARRANRLEEARRLYESSLESFQKAGGDRDLDSARARSNLGLVLSYLGRHEEAAATLQRALDGFETSLGANHPSVGEVYNALGTNAVLQDRNAQAVRYYGRALEIQRRSFPEGHRNIVMAHYNVGLASFNLGRYPQASRHFEAGMKMRAELTGPPQGSDRAWLTYLGASQLLAGDKAAARVTLDRALALPEVQPTNQLRMFAAVAFASTDPHRARTIAHDALAALADDDREARVPWEGFLAIEDSLDRLRGL